MLRVILPGLLFLVAARSVADDKAPSGVAVATAVAAAAPVTPKSAAASKPAAKHLMASTTPAEGKTPSTADGTAAPTGDVKMSGMSILGNEDAPKSLALVPWKSSQLGDMPSVSRLLDSAAQPVDKDVFTRELAYYTFKSDGK